MLVHDTVITHSYRGVIIINDRCHLPVIICNYEEQGIYVLLFSNNYVHLIIGRTVVFCIKVLFGFLTSFGFVHSVLSVVCV